MYYCTNACVVFFRALGSSEVFFFQKLLCVRENPGRLQLIESDLTPPPPLLAPPPQPFLDVIKVLTASSAHTHTRGGEEAIIASATCHRERPGRASQNDFMSLFPRRLT